MSTSTSSRKGIGGPKTPEGRFKVSLNALKHGLDAKSPQAMEMINDMVGVSFAEIHQQMIEHYKPKDAMENLLVRRIARCAWRLALTEAMEDECFAFKYNLAPGQRFQKIINIERQVDTHLHRAVAALERKRASEQMQNEQNKLNSTPAPRSTHAQQTSEFVPPKPVPAPNQEPGTENPEPVSIKQSDDFLQLDLRQRPIAPPTVEYSQNTTLYPRRHDDDCEIQTDNQD